MFDRLIRIIGEDNLKKLNSKRVLVLGLGGVGGYVVESLVRSGINDITIVDYDTIDITNLNRQIITNQDNIGELKVEEKKNERQRNYYKNNRTRNSGFPGHSYS